MSVFGPERNGPALGRALSTFKRPGGWRRSSWRWVRCRVVTYRRSPSLKAEQVVDLWPGKTDQKLVDGAIPGWQTSLSGGADGRRRRGFRSTTAHACFPSAVWRACATILGACCGAWNALVNGPGGAAAHFVPSAGPHGSDVDGVRHADSGARQGVAAPGELTNQGCPRDCRCSRISE